MPTACSDPSGTLWTSREMRQPVRNENGQPVIEWRGHFTGMVTNGNATVRSHTED